MKYLIVKCTPLEYQFECEADKTPECITCDISRYKKEFNCEIWEIYEDGTLKCVKEYEGIMK